MRQIQFVSSEKKILCNNFHSEIANNYKEMAIKLNTIKLKTLKQYFLCKTYFKKNKLDNLILFW